MSRPLPSCVPEQGRGPKLEIAPGLPGPVDGHRTVTVALAVSVLDLSRAIFFIIVKLDYISH